ncbi:uncharacterized protein Pyn_36815 [Prunus yedoensis var. nudiflora]|uniref:Uncharacterized protein n=1 Tax=Prunus yedoensis var. nudiflora TaxID=2094558 RepID=A0A314URF2_PRUYE|nr:uncharacterized protein Pyn_36815 [Prunus yedoensis var. nudiflora]
MWQRASSSPHILGTSDAGVDNALLLPAVLPPTPLLLETSDIAAGTALHLPAVSPPTPPLLGTSDIAAGTALHLPAVLPPIPLLPGTSDIVAATALHLPAAPPVVRLLMVATRSVMFLPTVPSWGIHKRKAYPGRIGKFPLLRSKPFSMVVSRFSGLSTNFFHFVTNLTDMQCSRVPLHPETIGVLRKFMDKNGGFMDIMGVTSSFSKSAAFRALGLVLHGMDTM